MTIGLDTKIWRYLPYKKFENILEKKQLYFPSANQFSDSWEMYPPRAFLEPSVWKKMFENNVSAKNHDVDLDLLAEDAIEFFTYSYQNRDKEYSFSCWTYEQEDNATMWELFAKEETAIAISTTPNKILGACRTKSNHERALNLMVGCVNYIDYDSLEFPSFNQPVYLGSQNISADKSITLPFFYKKKSYSAEKEIRICIFSGQGNEAVRNVDFDIESLIEDVMLGPQASPTFAKEIEDKCAKNLPKSKIKRSKLHPPEVLLSNRYQDKITNNQKLSEESKNGYSYIVFDNIDSFTEWHERVSKHLGYPQIGRNGATGAYAYNACGTFSSAQPNKHPETEKICAPATESISFNEHKLLTKKEVEKLGFFHYPEDLA